MTAVIDEGLISYLQGYAGLVSLIGTRTYSFKIPQDATLPCLVIQRISTPRIHTHDTSGAGGDLASPRFQFDAWGETYSAVKGVTDQLRAALNGKTGSIGTGASAYTIQGALVQDEAPEYDQSTALYRSRSDYIIWHED